MFSGELFEHYVNKSIISKIENLLSESREISGVEVKIECLELDTKLYGSGTILRKGASNTDVIKSIYDIIKKDIFTITNVIVLINIIDYDDNSLIILAV